MSILAADRALMDRLDAPLSSIPIPPHPKPRAEEALWHMHLQFYRMFPEIEEIFGLARRFGTGSFGKTVASARPGRWTATPFFGFPTAHVRYLGPVLDKVFQESFLSLFGVDKGRDTDLAKRLSDVLRRVSDDDRRLLERYIDDFEALYPREHSARALAAIFHEGLKKDFAKGLAGLVTESPDVGAEGKGSGIGIGNGSGLASGSGSGSDDLAWLDQINTTDSGSGSATGSGAAGSDSGSGTGSGIDTGSSQGSGSSLGSGSAQGSGSDQGSGSEQGSGSGAGSASTASEPPPEKDPFAILGAGSGS